MNKLSIWRTLTGANKKDFEPATVGLILGLRPKSPPIPSYIQPVSTAYELPARSSNKAKCLKPLKEHGQMDMLIKHLEAGGTATAQEIIHQCRTTNPTALLTYTRKRLREDGKELVSKWETGGGKRWLRYSLAK